MAVCWAPRGRAASLRLEVRASEDSACWVPSSRPALDCASATGAGLPETGLIRRDPAPAIMGEVLINATAIKVTKNRCVIRDPFKWCITFFLSLKAIVISRTDQQ